MGKHYSTSTIKLSSDQLQWIPSWMIQEMGTKVAALRMQPTNFMHSPSPLLNLPHMVILNKLPSKHLFPPVPSLNKGSSVLDHHRSTAPLVKHLLHRNSHCQQQVMWLHLHWSHQKPGLQTSQRKERWGKRKLFRTQRRRLLRLYQALKRLANHAHARLSYSCL